MAAGVLERGQAIGVTATIFALSSGRPPAGIAIVRVSGPAAFATLRAVAGIEPPVRTMTLAAFRDPTDGRVIDRGLVVRFAAPQSATGDDLVEFHLHGGVAVVGAMLRILAASPDLQLATPGAFTRRAFDNGRLDLAQVEGLADLIAADTEAARRQALEQSGGGLARVVDRWRAALVAARAEIEADLDFAEAEDDVARHAQTTGTLRVLRGEIVAAIADGARSEQLRNGLTIAVVGPPNVGKSSLINALARRDVAIVSEHAGTTRDVIEVRLDLAGVAVTIVDTAGLRAATDPVEEEGIRRGRDRAATADRVLRIGTANDDDCDIVNKIDISRQTPGRRGDRWFVSARTGAGISGLLDELSRWAYATVRPDEPPLVARERQRIALTDGVQEIDAALGQSDAVLRAEHLRRAIDAMRAVTGAVAMDDVLDAIFSQFCIGK